MKGKLTSDIVFLSVGTLNRKLLYAVLSKNPHVIHLTLDFNYPCQNIFKGSVFMFLFKNAFIQACFEDSSFLFLPVSAHLFFSPEAKTTKD